MTVISFSSCTRDDDESITETNRYSSDAVESYEDLFTVFWSVMDNEYNYFYEEKERSGLDWDNVYAEYLPKFKALKTMKDRENYSNDEILKEANLTRSYFKDIVNRISDKHFILQVDLPATRTEDNAEFFFVGKGKESPLYYNKVTTMNFMRASKLDNPYVYRKPNTNFRVLGGRLSSNPEIYYFSLSQFSMNSFDIHLQDKDNFLFKDIGTEGILDRSQIEQNEYLNSIENDVLKQYIMDWAFDIYNNWNEALTTTLQSDVLTNEIEKFQNTEVVTDALYNETWRLQDIIDQLPATIIETLQSRFNNGEASMLDRMLVGDENALNFTYAFDDQIEKTKISITSIPTHIT
ncbi:hypothetical protein [Galbibacter pacificus]|uniref:Uncharacterized protein n=1 Tax=Galbibacter pacificus TaxID=2996052 RepID=A0ABT6FVK2_9FLAO|nr:hypothetical protein [Galbibacter pacificus]MDG3583789.1 hypothetical protein [Galbibacter pacificus]MDG3587293.1 hypothetical protein [Galbibacter pacificus]